MTYYTAFFTLILLLCYILNEKFAAMITYQILWLFITASSDSDTLIVSSRSDGGNGEQCSKSELNSSNDTFTESPGKETRQSQHVQRIGFDQSPHKEIVTNSSIVFCSVNVHTVKKMLCIHLHMVINSIPVRCKYSCFIHRSHKTYTILFCCS